MISVRSGSRIGTPRLLTHCLAHVSANVLCLDKVLSRRHCRPGVPTVVYTSPSLALCWEGIRSQSCPPFDTAKRSVLVTSIALAGPIRLSAVFIAICDVVIHDTLASEVTQSDS